MPELHLQNLDQALCSKSEQKLSFMTTPQFPNLQQTVVNMTFIFYINWIPRICIWNGFFNWFQSSRSQIFVLGTRSAHFESEKKLLSLPFFYFRKGTSGTRNENLRPVLKSGLWRCNVESNLLTFGYWKVVFSVFLILYRAFSHFVHLRKFRIRKRGRTSSQNV